MAMVEMQTTAALAESRRKMQARRRLKNRIALTLSMATMAFGLFWLICAVHRNDAAAKYGRRWSGERPGG